MASKYSIETIFKLIDSVTAPLDKIGVKGNVVGKALKKDFLQTNDSLAKIGKTAGKVAGDIAKTALKAGAALAGAAAAGAAAFAVKGLKDAVEFEKSMAKIGARAGLTQEQLKAFSNDMINVSNSTGAALDILTEAQLEAVTKGVAVADSVKFVEVAVKAAGGGFTDTSTAISGLTGVLNAYGLEASSATQISDQMMAAAKAGGVSFQDMATKLEHVLPVAAKFGVSSDQLFASIASLTSQGVPIADAVKKIKSSLEKDGAKGMFNLTNGERFNSILNDITNSAGATEDAFGRIDQTTEEKWGSVLNKVKNTGIKLGMALLPIFNKIVDKLTLFADKFTAIDFEPIAKKVEAVVDKLLNSFDFEKVIDNIGKFIGTVFNAIGAIVKIAGVIWNLRGLIIGIAAAWGIYKAAQVGAVVVGGIMGMVKAVQVLMAAQKGMNVVQAIFNVLLNANPIGLIITGIGVLIGLVILAVTHWKQITAALKSAWEWIKNVAGIIRDGLCSAFFALAGFIEDNQNKVLAFISLFSGPFAIILSMVNELRNNWGAVVEVFKTDGIIAGIKRLAGVLLSGLLAPLQGFLEMLAKIPGVGDKIAPALGKIEEVRNNLKGIDPAEAAQAPAEPRGRRGRAASRPVPQEAAQVAPQAASKATPPALTQTPPVAAPSALPGPLMAAPATALPAVPQVRQPALLDLRAGSAPQAAPSAPRAASAWNVPATVTSAAPEAIIAPSPAIPAVPPAITTQARAAPITAAESPITRTAQAPAPAPVIIPVKYDFPEIIIPEGLIKNITIPVQWDFLSGLLPEFPVPPEAAQPVSPAIARAEPPAAVNSAPPKINQVIPPQAAQPVSRSVGESITPPEPPMTTAEQIIYSKSETVEDVHIKITTDPEIKARVVKPPKSPNVKLEVSGDV